MITIYHNNRCGKSRCALERLEQTGRDFQLVEYLKNPPTEAELLHILQLQNKKPLEIIRQKEPVFQENFKGKHHSDAEWIAAMIAYPILIERPIVVAGDKAWVARDDETLAQMEAVLGSGTP